MIMKHACQLCKNKNDKQTETFGVGVEGRGGGLSYKTKESPEYTRLGLWETATKYKFSFSFICSLCQGCIHSLQREFSNIIIQLTKYLV